MSLSENRNTFPNPKQLLSIQLHSIPLAMGVIRGQRDYEEVLITLPTQKRARSPTKAKVTDCNELLAHAPLPEKVRASRRLDERNLESVKDRSLMDIRSKTRRNSNANEKQPDPETFRPQDSIKEDQRALREGALWEIKGNLSTGSIETGFVGDPVKKATENSKQSHQSNLPLTSHKTKLTALQGFPKPIFRKAEPPVYWKVQKAVPRKTPSPFFARLFNNKDLQTLAPQISKPTAQPSSILKATVSPKTIFNHEDFHDEGYETDLMDYEMEGSPATKAAVWEMAMGFESKPYEQLEAFEDEGVDLTINTSVYSITGTRTEPRSPAKVRIPRPGARKLDKAIYQGQRGRALVKAKPEPIFDELNAQHLDTFIVDG